jgi:hypothetical protein
MCVFVCVRACVRALEAQATRRHCQKIKIGKKLVVGTGYTHTAFTLANESLVKQFFIFNFFVIIYFLVQATRTRLSPSRMRAS